MNDKKELYEKLKEAEKQIKESNNKNNVLSKIYEEKIKDGNLNYQNTWEE